MAPNVQKFQIWSPQQFFSCTKRMSNCMESIKGSPEKFNFSVTPWGPGQGTRLLGFFPTFLPSCWGPPHGQQQGPLSYLLTAIHSQAWALHSGGWVRFYIFLSFMYHFSHLPTQTIKLKDFLPWHYRHAFMQDPYRVPPYSESSSPVHHQHLATPWG